METEHNPRLNSGELSQLWIGYMQDSLTVCSMKHFLQVVEDDNIRPVIQQCLDISQSHIPKLTALFDSDDRPVPIGFTEQDVDLQAPRLFSDDFVLSNIMNTAQMGLQMYAQAKSLCPRQDVRNYFSECLKENDQLYDQAVSLLLEKGIYVPSPTIQVPSQVDFVTKQNFTAGWFGKQKPLLAHEIANLYANIQRNALGKHLITAFSQVAKSKKVREYFQQGSKVSTKQVQTFTSTLQENGLPASMISDEPVTDSTTPPFSDKFMLFQVTVMNGIGIAYYGTALSTSMRNDISALYPRLATEIGKYAKDGLNLMIENGWLEEPPQMIDHDQLAKNKG